MAARRCSSWRGPTQHQQLGCWILACCSLWRVAMTQHSCQQNYRERPERTQELMARRLSRRSVHKSEVASLGGALAMRDRATTAAGAVVVRIAGPSPVRLGTSGRRPCRRRRRAPWAAGCRPVTRFAKCHTQSCVDRGADAPDWSALPPASACPLRLWLAAMLSWNLPRSANQAEGGAGQSAGRYPVVAGPVSSTTEGALGPSMMLVAVAGAIQGLKKVAGQNSWLPGAAGHGKSQTWTGWADCDFGEWWVMICEKTLGTSMVETVARYLAASEGHGSTCSRSELA